MTEASRWRTETEDDIPHRHRPKITNSITPRVECGCGHLYITISFLMDDPDYLPYEVFPHLGKAGGCEGCQLEGITRCITAGLKRGIPARVYIDELKGIRCPKIAWSEGKAVLSCSDAIAGVLAEYMDHIDNDTIDEYINSWRRK